jgi:photosystem II stability/assembly factor-like uncharacterized protein
LKNFARLSRSPFVCLLTTSIALAAQTIPPELYNGLKWRLLGPFRGGRAVAVAGVPGNSTTFYFGAVNGGLWQTTDAGVVWKPIFDGQHVASIGAVAVAWSDPKVIYVGTGESDIRSDLASGDGVYKSMDRGQTWTNVGLGDTRQISKLLVDPKNADVVYVAALGHAYAANSERGVFKSSDGGASWTKVLDPGPDIGAADLAIATDHPQIVFATTWHARRPPWSTYGPIGGPGSGLYRSLDGGKSWSRLSMGLPEGDWNRSGVAVSPDGQRVYALIDAKNHAGLYRSDDGGNRWMLANSDRRLITRSWYFSSITVDPQNADVLYVPNVALYRSEDGGKTISVVRGAPGGDDYHQIWIDPKDSSRMILATDQGTTISVDHGETWSTWYNQATAQLYHVITDDKFPYSVYGNQQDSGAIGVPSRTDHKQISNRDSFSASGSESGYIAPDPNNSDILYVSALYGGVSRFDLRTSLGQDITPWPYPTFTTEINERKYRDPWTPVLVFSPVDKRSLYLGTQFVMKTVDGGLNWETISPDLTGATPKKPDEKPQGPPTVENAKPRGYGVVFTIAPSPLNADLIWAGSDTSLIHLTRDGGKTWQDVTPKELSDWSKISMIEASHFDPAEAYAAVDRHRLDDQTPYLYRTRDYGASWQRITDGIHAPSFLRAVREDPESKGLLFAGTALGFVVSFDDGDHWQSLQLNLPASSVEDMVIHHHDLVIATHGRSFWILDDINPLRQSGEAVTAAKAFLYRPATAVRVDNDAFLATPFPPEEPAAENPPDGAILDYYLKGDAHRVSLEIFDAQHILVRAFSSGDSPPAKPAAQAIAERWLAKPQVLEKTAGMHRFVWDLRWGQPSIKPVDEGEDSEVSLPQGPRAAPGTYEVRLTVDDTILTQSLKLVMDPRSSATPEELDRQTELGRLIFAALAEGQRARDELDRVDRQLSKLENQGTVNPDLVPAIKQMRGEIAKIIAGEPGPDISGLSKANTGLGAALRVVESSDRPIPSQAAALFEESSRELKSRVGEWDRLKKTLLAQFNQRLQRAGMPPILRRE